MVPGANVHLTPKMTTRRATRLFFRTGPDGRDVRGSNTGYGMGRIAGLVLLVFWAQVAPAQTPFASFDKASESVLNDPHDLEIGPDGNLYIADKFGARIVVMDPESLEVISTFGDGQLAGVHDISFGPDGAAVVAVTGLSAIAIYDFPDGTPSLRNFFSGFPRTEGALWHSNGNIYVMASGTGQLVSIDMTSGTLAGMVPGHFGAHDVAEAPDGSIWVGDNATRRLVRYDAQLNLMQVIEGAEIGMNNARYLAVDDFGRLIVADQDGHQAVMIDPVENRLLGVIGDGTPGEGPGRFDDPEGAEVLGDTYYFSDSDNNRVVRYVVVMN